HDDETHAFDALHRIVSELEIRVKARVTDALESAALALVLRIDEGNLQIVSTRGHDLAREPVILVRTLRDDETRIARFEAGLRDPFDIAPPMSGEVRLDDDDVAESRGIGDGCFDGHEVGCTFHGDRREHPWRSP